MKKKILLTIAILLIATTGWAGSYISGSGGSLTNMTDCGKYATLQACVNAAGSGGYAYIPPGTYTSGIALTASHNGITIQGAGYGSYIHVATGNAVSVTGTGGGHASGITLAGLRPDTDSTTAYPVDITYLDDSKISDLHFKNSPYGSMRLAHSSYNKINNLDVVRTTAEVSTIKYELLVTDASNNNTVSDSTFIGHGGLDADLFCAVFFGSNAVDSQGNTFTGSTVKGYYAGLQASTSSYLSITGDTFNTCYQGIYMDSAYGTITGNTFSSNTTGISMYGGGEFIVSGNNFFHNTTNISMPFDTLSGNTVGDNHYVGGSFSDLTTSGSSSLVRGNLTTIVIAVGTTSVTGTTTFTDSGTTQFANVKAGDILYVPRFWPEYRRIVQVIDNNNLRLDKPFIIASGSAPTEAYRIYRKATVIDGNGDTILAHNAVVRGGGHQLTEHIIPAAVTLGSIATINATPTAAGTGYNANDLEYVTTGSGDALVKVLTVTNGVPQTVGLVDSGSYGYAVATGQATTKFTGIGIDASQYPTQDDAHVKATSHNSLNYPYYATDPTKSLTGSADNTTWLSNLITTNQRFHIDLGSAMTINKIYYENFHHNGCGPCSRGVKNFTFWGSNTSGNFADLDYTHNGTWVQLTTSQTTFDEHIGADAPEPKYITVSNTTAYRYYAFKFADNYGDGDEMGVRRIELQIHTPPSGLTVNVTAVGLTAAQVSDTTLVNTGQAAADITNYLPTAKAGYKTRACVITPQTNHFWAFNNNSGILNNASGDVTALAGSDGTAGSTHGIKFGSGATNLVKGDCTDFWTANIDSTNWYYQWFSQKVVGTTTITAY
jgi:parallel beta-helix repeat protein